MKDLFKQLFVVLLILAALSSIYLGAYAPLAKAKSYIHALRSVPQAGSFEEFKQIFDVPLTFSSPVGQEEVVKYTASNILDIIAQPNQPESVMRALADYIEPYIFQNDVRHLILMGQIYYTLWMNYGRQEADFEKAVGYFQKVRAIGPKLPPALYSLFSLYKEHGDTAKAKDAGRAILEYWPSDKEVSRFVNGTASSSAATSTAQ